MSFLELLLPQWRKLLQGWAQDGTFSRAAQAALGLDGKPALLGKLVSQLGTGDFSALPPIELVPAATMPTAAGGRGPATAPFTSIPTGSWALAVAVC